MQCSRPLAICHIPLILGVRHHGTTAIGIQSIILDAISWNSRKRFKILWGNKSTCCLSLQPNVSFSLSLGFIGCCHQSYCFSFPLPMTKCMSEKIDLITTTAIHEPGSALNSMSLANRKCTQDATHMTHTIYNHKTQTHMKHN